MDTHHLRTTTGSPCTVCQVEQKIASLDSKVEGDTTKVQQDEAALKKEEGEEQQIEQVKCCTVA